MVYLYTEIECDRLSRLGIFWKTTLKLYRHLIITNIPELNTAVIVKTVDANPLKPLLALWKKLMAGSPLIKGEYRNEKVL